MNAERSGDVNGQKSLQREIMIRMGHISKSSERIRSSRVST